MCDTLHSGGRGCSRVLRDRRLTRRTFLKAAGAAGAGALFSGRPAPFVTAATALAPAGVPQYGGRYQNSASSVGTLDPHLGFAGWQALCYNALTVRSLFGLRQINPSADLDEGTLTAIAEMTGGKYFRARDTEEFAKIYGMLDELEPAESDEAGFRPVAEFFHWPLGLALVLAAGAVLGAVLPARFAVAAPRGSPEHA